MSGMYDMATRGDPAEIGIGSQVASDIAQQYSPDTVSSGYTAGTITPGYQSTSKYLEVPGTRYLVN